MPAETDSQNRLQDAIKFGSVVVVVDRSVFIWKATGHADNDKHFLSGVWCRFY
jgi:hypothetical protein